MALTDTSKQILRLMMNRKVLSGSQIRSSVRLSGDELTTALQALVNEGLIDTNVVALDKDSLNDTYFNVNLRSMDKARMLVS